mgnify:CR=1 FL=1
MPLVGNVIFGEDNFGITQAQAYSKMSGHKIEPSPKIELIFKGSNFNEDEYLDVSEGYYPQKGE